MTGTVSQTLFLMVLIILRNTGQVYCRVVNYVLLFFNRDFIFLLLLFFNFTILYWFCHTSTEGWYGEGGGRGVQEWELIYTRGGFMLMFYLFEGG